MKVTVLVEEENGHHPELSTQQGLSLFIEANGNKMIFDFGIDSTYRENSESLGVDLTDTDFAVLSHAHNDHGGGIKDFLYNYSVAPVYMSELCLDEYFTKSMAFLKKNIGVSNIIESLDEADRSRIVVINEDYVIPVGEGFHLLFNKYDDGFIPKSNMNVFKSKDGELIPDDFGHEIILVVEEYDGISIVTGCSHSGITNMVKTAVNAFPNKKVKLVVGGFHLINPSKGTLAETDETVEKIAEELKALGVTRAVTGYCTGEEGFRILKEVEGLEVIVMNIGDVIYSE